MKRSVVVILFLVLSTWFPRNGFSQSITELEKLYMGKWVLVTDQKINVTIEKQKVGYLCKVLLDSSSDFGLVSGGYVAYLSEGILYLYYDGNGLVYRIPLIIDSMNRLLLPGSNGQLYIFKK